jgi:hypothetical protein
MIGLLVARATLVPDPADQGAFPATAAGLHRDDLVFARVVEESIAEPEKSKAPETDSAGSRNQRFQELIPPVRRGGGHEDASHPDGCPPDGESIAPARRSIPTAGRAAGPVRPVAGTK